jgi:hypothetical protein
MQKRYWIYIALAVFWLADSITKLHQFTAPVMIGAIVNWLFVASILILIIEAVYRKLTKKKQPQEIK